LVYLTLSPRKFEYKRRGKLTRKSVEKSENRPTIKPHLFGVGLTQFYRFALSVMLQPHRYTPTHSETVTHT